MGCKSCGTGTDENGVPRGCGSKGACGTGSCNKMSTYDWLADLGIDDPYATNIVEVSFKDGASKDFFHAPRELQVFTGDNVAVEAKNGYNIGRITLSGELVRLQMKKKRVKESKVTDSVLRRANQRDMEKLAAARELEKETLVRARAIARSSHLNMKISDVEYQGDCRKATIYYTSDERIDFRELVRQYSHQFRVKIEMRQIGPRVESARLGGIGSCGRELCCSTWLSDFKPVNTAAARYQNIAINQTKLSGQCGRLKCCLNYELDTYMEAMEAFPKKADKLRTEAGLGILIKTDIFKGIMYYTYKENRGALFPIPVAKVHDIIALNKAGQKPESLKAFQLYEEETEEIFGYEDVTGAVELPAEKRSKRRRKKKSGRRPSGKSGNKPSAGKTPEAKTTGSEGGSPAKRSRRRPKKKSANQGGEASANGQNTGRKSRKSRRGRRKKSGGQGDKKD
ncbi:regulatory iron-sulfur-containing complex subunit RicT [Lewinella sp. W8]|uniref:PSP1 domain-containing protein n=1 Tax=Lewinella sp. W8 TaxID=2528208 RepID=UPI0010677B10|nr:regulatory iron-sulfur-containing complex subunit RicT [Lewinella sp. W8]MTB51629.1 hypothetical protein [Lewinella sp. W8]